MLWNLIGGIILTNIGIIGTIYLFTNSNNFWHLLWLLPTFLIGIIGLYISLRPTIM